MTTLHQQPHQPIPAKTVRVMLEQLHRRLGEDLSDPDLNPWSAARRVTEVMAVIPKCELVKG